MVQERIEKKLKLIVKKHDWFLFLVARLILFIVVANATITLPERGTMELSKYLFLLFEAVSYLLVYAIIAMFPTLRDFGLIRN